MKCLNKSSPKQNASVWILTTEEKNIQAVVVDISGKTMKDKVGR